jgi:magnesium transporter
LIPRWTLLEILLEEHHEDMARLGGFLGTVAVARTASQEGVWRRVWHRMPWLGLGLAGTIVAAALLGQFEETLTDNVILAFFLPGIVYMADAIGTQSEAIIIRGLSVGVSIRAMVLREVLTGVFVGVLLSVLFYFAVLVGWGDPNAALVISLSLFAASSIASSVALLLPWTLDSFGIDPAFGSGPLATVIQDILSLLIYLAIAVVLLG